MILIGSVAHIKVHKPTPYTNCLRNPTIKWVQKFNSIAILQEELYNSYMPARIEGFLSGLNCNIMAYGQTGTGKTHTMFGPPGYMARAAKGRDVRQSLALL